MSRDKTTDELEAALARRSAYPVDEALRIFHGPGDGTGALRELALDRFGRHLWITRWGTRRDSDAEAALRIFIERHFASAVELVRPEKELPEEPRAYCGTPPADPFAAAEGPARFWIKLLGARHPGLFLDHRPVREWLLANARDLRVLNAFAYTGSLSVAAGLGGAREVTTLDLSRPVVRWARDNWELNGLPAEHARFIDGDVFDWLPRLAKKGTRYDCVILDPPSFSRGPKGVFSTAKDLARLHAAALGTLEPAGGLLITSINSANVTRRQYELEVRRALEETGFTWAETLHEISQPATFPARDAADAYLKGWIIRVAKSSGSGAANSRKGASSASIG
jgi:23S rRNA (cytosine1962-C5)-methyltransferase